MMKVEKPELVNALAILLSDKVTFSFMLQGGHWNVTGPDFHQYHGFFGMIYGDVEGAIDPLAENIRKMGAMAPSKLSDFARMTNISETSCEGDPQKILKSLYDANEVIIGDVNDAFMIASNLNEQGIADFLVGRDDMHKKWRWQISASMGQGLSF